jgi:hypothetical protein
MKKYSVEWKDYQTKKYGGWAQTGYGPNGYKCWFWHYIRYGTEYAGRDWHMTKQDCERENRQLKNEMGRGKNEDARN